MKNWFEKQFKLSEFHTNVKTELLAGITTFCHNGLCFSNVPNILSGAGFEKNICDADCYGTAYYSYKLAPWLFIQIVRLLLHRDWEVLGL